MVKTVKIQFTDHTVVDPKTVHAKHCGRLQLRSIELPPSFDPNKVPAGFDPSKVGTMQYYFPKGTVIEIPDYLGSGSASLYAPNPDDQEEVKGGPVVLPDGTQVQLPDDPMSPIGK